MTNRLNAEISAFSEGDLDKYEFLTRKDLKYKPNALDKAKFEFSPLGKAFNQGLDKKAENNKEGVIKLLKDIRDRMVRPIAVNNSKNNGGNDSGNNDDDNGNDNGNNDDNNGNDNGNNDDDNGNGYDDNDDNEYDGDDGFGDKHLLKLDRLLKNLKDDKKFLKTSSENIDDKSKEELEAEELDRMFKKLKNKKILEPEKLESLKF